MIADYDGTVLIVSHDRDFLDRTVTITLGLDGSGRVDIVAGGYEDWERKRSSIPATRSQQGAALTGPKAGTRPVSSSGHRASSGNKKLSYRDQRDYDLLPDRIHALEAQIARDEDALHDPDLYARDPERFAALTAAIERARAERDAAEHRWLELAEKAEAMAS